MIPASVHLPDGRCLEYVIRPSEKAKALRLKMTIRDGLIVIAPHSVSQQMVVDVVAQKGEWIAERLKRFDEARRLMGNGPPAPPQAIDLPALAESWRIEYRATKAATVAATVDRHGRLVVHGAIDDAEKSKSALRRWLARRARETLGPWVASLAAQHQLTPSGVVIRNQRTRWGSCSAKGEISLNCKLLFLPRDLARYVLLHELSHLITRNHTKHFWMFLRQFEPHTDILHGQMRDAWKRIPPWASPFKIGDEGV